MKVSMVDLQDGATSRVCRGCEARKALGEFYRDQRAPRGRATLCKDCWRGRREALRDGVNGRGTTKSRRHGD